MKKVFKFTFEKRTETFQFPRDARIVSVAEQGGKVCLWVLGTWGGDLMTRVFECYGTGHEVLDLRIFVGTAHLPAHGLVIHVFEVP
jgi:hypothetical protein